MSDKTKTHCNTCDGVTNHGVLHSVTTNWSDDEYPIWGSDRYETLQCCGCEEIKLRHTSDFSEYEQSTVRHFPPSIFRKRPSWFGDLSLDLPQNEDFVEALLDEIYIAIQNNLPNLATMGVRSLLEKIMVAKVGDNGSFAKNLNKFETDGFVSRVQRERLESILEAGHATIHRHYTPKVKDVITLLDITEHVVETAYIHESKVSALKMRVPNRRTNG